MSNFTSVIPETFLSNKLLLAGRVFNEPEFYCDAHGEKLFTFDIEVPRRSGALDKIRVMTPARNLSMIKTGAHILVEGQVRTYSKYNTGKRRVLVYAFCQYMTSITDSRMNDLPDCNVVSLRGSIFRSPVLRPTPKGREICDFSMLVNRSCDRSDCIPVIAWGKDARFLDGKSPKTSIEITGRLQSRIYTKQVEGEVIESVAYEVSTAQVKLI